MKRVVFIFLYLSSLEFLGCRSPNNDNKDDINNEEQSIVPANNEEGDLPFEIDSATFFSDPDTAYIRPREYSRDSEQQIATQFDYPSFSMIFHGYGFQETRSENFIEELSSSEDTTQFGIVHNDGVLSFRVKSDTLMLVEDVFNDLSRCLSRLFPKIKMTGLKFHIH